MEDDKVLGPDELHCARQAARAIQELGAESQTLPDKPTVADLLSLDLKKAIVRDVYKSCMVKSITDKMFNEEENPDPAMAALRARKPKPAARAVRRN